MLSKELKLDIYRICQEAINNIQKKGLVKNFGISIEMQNNNVSIIILEDSLHLNKNEVPTLANGIKERIASLQGQVIIESSAGQGSSIIAIIPLDENQGNLNPDSLKVNLRKNNSKQPS